MSMPVPATRVCFLFVNLCEVLCLFSLLIGIFNGHCADALLQPIASFNDSRCVTGGVCATDPLFFTCELYEVFILRVVLPSGDQESISLGDINTADVALPGGFTAVSLRIHPTHASKRNIFLTLSIMNASLLDGGMIICDDTTEANKVMAGCPVDTTPECNDTEDVSGNMDVPGNDDGRFIGLMSGIVGGGVVVVISGGVICLLVIIVAKKIRTRPNVGERRQPTFLASSVMKETPVDESSQSNVIYNDSTMNGPHSSQLKLASPVMKTSDAKRSNTDPTYSTIPDLPTPNDTSQTCALKEQTHAGDPRRTYQVPNAILRTPHPITGVVYTDINPGNKRGDNLLISLDGSMYQEDRTASQKGMKGENDEESLVDIAATPNREQKLSNYPTPTAPTSWRL